MRNKALEVVTWAPGNNLTWVTRPEVRSARLHVHGMDLQCSMLATYVRFAFKGLGAVACSMHRRQTSLEPHTDNVHHAFIMHACMQAAAMEAKDTWEGQSSQHVTKQYEAQAPPKADPFEQLAAARAAAAASAASTAPPVPVPSAAATAPGAAASSITPTAAAAPTSTPAPAAPVATSAQAPGSAPPPPPPVSAPAATAVPGSPAAATAGTPPGLSGRGASEEPPGGPHVPGEDLVRTDSQHHDPPQIELVSSIMSFDAADLAKLQDNNQAPPTASGPTAGNSIVPAPSGPGFPSLNGLFKLRGGNGRTPHASSSNGATAAASSAPQPPAAAGSASSNGYAGGVIPAPAHAPHAAENTNGNGAGGVPPPGTVPAAARGTGAMSRVAQKGGVVRTPRVKQVTLAADGMVQNHVCSLTVNELRTELKRRGLPCSGNHMELVQRLLSAYGGDVL